jgi:predicted unusual protein kinase regulating ubiquinone biosynthesis (AarF/ABC1/UbiB family)
MGRRRRVVVGAAAVGAVVALLRRSGKRRAGGFVASGRGARNLQAARLAAGLGGGAALHRARSVFASAARKEELDAALELRSAEQVAATLGQMKGALMKVGQLASFVDDGMPEPVRQALSQLQQDVPPMSPELAAGVVREELGAPPEDVFAEWDPVPIAAASIGQVHRAMTRDGRAVAVKVQYPGIAEAVEADLANLDLARMVMPFFWRSLDAEVVTSELRARLTEELDYVKEAANQRLFASWYEGHPFIHVPSVVDELSTRRVLTSELAAGARFSDLERWSQEERDLAAETIYRFVYRSLYRLHAFNGDPHPGNYLFGPGGDVTFLDFGLIRRFTATEIDALLAPARAVAFHPGDARALRMAAEEAGWLVPDAPVTDEQSAEYGGMFWEYVAKDEPFTVTAEYVTQLMRRAFFDKESFGDVLRYTTVPRSFVILQRINVGLIAIFGRLNATANWRRISEELWPFVDGPPSTPLGEREAEWWAAKQSVST